MTVLAQASAGTAIAVVAAIPATYDATGFAALTFTTVGGVSDISDYGPKTTVNTFTSLTDRVTQKSTGAINYGSVTVQAAYLRSDAGQAILKAALGVNTGISCKVTHDDASVDYFTAIVSTNTRHPSGVDAFFMATIGLEINGPIIEV